MRGTVQALALAALLFVAAPAHAAMPAAGQRYDGHSSGGPPIYLTVSADGSRLGSYSFTQHRGKCSNGWPWRSGLLSEGEGPALIDASGAFAYQSPAERGVAFSPNGRHVIRGRFQASFSGQFVGDGTTMTGTLTTTFSGHGVTCSGTVSLIAYLDGSPGAPFKTKSIWTGTYAGRTSIPSDFSIRVFLPGHVLSSIRMEWAARCHHGTYSETSLFRDVELHGNRFSANRVSEGPVRGGLRSSTRIRVRGEFFFNHSLQVHGSWTTVTKLTRRGRRVDTCRRRIKFAGDYKG